jgi:hypothetical protein
MGRWAGLAWFLIKRRQTSKALCEVREEELWGNDLSLFCVRRLPPRVGGYRSTRTLRYRWCLLQRPCHSSNVDKHWVSDVCDRARREFFRSTISRVRYFGAVAIGNRHRGHIGSAEFWQRTEYESDPKSQIPNPQFQISNFKVQISNPNSQISNLKSQINDPRTHFTQAHQNRPHQIF